MESPTLKTSTIYIAAGDSIDVYRSLDEVPPEQRAMLERTAFGKDAGVILIADRLGRVEVDRALKGLPSRLESRRLTAQAGRQKRAALPALARRRLSWPTITWRTGVLWALGAASLLAWLALSGR